MNALLIALVFTWPVECETIGNLYLEAARIRDSGVKLEEAVRQVQLPSTRVSLLSVYARPDMGAEQWKYYVIGLCTGTMDEAVRPPPSEERFLRRERPIMTNTVATRRSA